MSHRQTVIVCCENYTRNRCGMRTMQFPIQTPTLLSTTVVSPYELVWVVAHEEQHASEQTGGIRWG